ncbi:MAG: hypothetical protein RSE00_02915 [Clostridia bacterium]
MKKVLTVLVVCMLAIGSCFFFWKNPDVTGKISNTIIAIYESLTNGEVATYTNSTKINKLQPKQATHYYNTLTQQQQIIYASFANSVKNLNPKVTLNGYNSEPNSNVEDIDKAVAAFFADHPEVFYVNNKYAVSTSQSFIGQKVELNISYLVKDKEELNSKIEKIDEKVKELVAKSSGKTGVEAEIILHDQLANLSVYYDYENIEDLPIETHNIYGAFINQKAVCDGFAKGMQILLDRVNIESIIVLGTLDSDAHAWNLVKLDDVWYNLDLTSDKSIKNANLEDNVVIHSYFNITTKQIEQTHVFDNKEIIPEAIATDKSYYKATGKYIKSTDDFSSTLQRILDDNKSEDIAEFIAENINNVPDKTAKVLQNKNNNIYSSGNKFVYYKILDSYILVKNK